MGHIVERCGGFNIGEPARTVNKPVFALYPIHGQSLALQPLPNQSNPKESFRF